MAELERGMRLRNGEQDEQMDKARSQMGAELASTKNQLASLQEHHNRLKAEFDSFREIASRHVPAAWGADMQRGSRWSGFFS